MGRAFFSQAYASAPAVRDQPEPTVDHCEKWSFSNQFDPDSDEFFMEAEYEAFLDPAQYHQDQQERTHALTVDAVDALTDLSYSSEGSVSDRGSSPMAVGADNPDALIADAYSSVDWQLRFLEAGAENSAENEWRRYRNDHHPTDTISYSVSRVTPLFSPRSPRPRSAEDQVNSGRSTRPRRISNVPAYLPPSSLRTSTTANEIDANGPASRSLRRTVNITPINIPVEPSTPSPLSPDTPSPSTPPPHMYNHRTPIHSMVNPSPAQTVSPRIYSWQRHNLPPMPTSPFLTRREGPLTNPRARLSMARIDAAPVRIRVQNTVS